MANTLNILIYIRIKNLKIYVITSYSIHYTKLYETKIELYDDKRPIFESYSVNSELEKALKETVWLDCGGYLVIQRTDVITSYSIHYTKLYDFYEVVILI